MKCFALISAALMALPAAPAWAEVGTKLTPAPAEVSIPNSRQIRFTSKLNGRDYLVSIAIPDEPVPATGYPVLYLLDPHWMFGTAVDSARLNEPGVMIVGIGYPLDDPNFVAQAAGKLDGLPSDLPMELSPHRRAIHASRIHDLAPPVSVETWRIGGYPPMAELSAGLSGGLDTFLDVIDKEVKPMIAGIAPVDRNQEALFGHSLGGLATLHAFFTRPESYDSFIAASPSIWAAPQLWDEQKKFGSLLAEGRIPAPRLLLTMGAKEQDGPGADAKMIDNMLEMASRLRPLKRGNQPLVVKDVVFADEDHGSVQQPSVSRSLIFAFRRPD